MLTSLWLLFLVAMVTGTFGPSTSFLLWSAPALPLFIISLLWLFGRGARRVVHWIVVALWLVLIFVSMSVRSEAAWKRGTISLTVPTWRLFLLTAFPLTVSAWMVGRVIGTLRNRSARGDEKAV